MIDDLIPQESWRFDEQVAARFENMLDRSIPAHRQLRTMIGALVAELGPEGTLLELGAGTGIGLRLTLDATTSLCAKRWEIVAVDNSEAMLSKLPSFVPGAKIDCVDLVSWQPPDWDVCLAVLVLQFLDSDSRRCLLARLADTRRPEALMVVVEKTVCSPELDSVYHDMKHLAGYSWEQIEAKRRSLEGVLLRRQACEIEEELRRFGRVERFWQTGPFIGWYVR